MAVKATSKPAEQLDQAATRLAAAATGLLSLLVAAGLIIYLVAADVQSGHVVAYLIGWAALFGVAFASSVQLARRQLWAHRFLLVFYMAAMVAEVVLLMMSLLWGPPAWWPAIAPLPAVLLPLLVGLAAVMVLLTRASVPNSRLRYSSMVALSVGVVIALAVAVNLIGQTRTIHRSMETLGRYGLSDRTKKILDDVQDQKIALTCIYSAGGEDKQTEELRPRTLELLQDMAEYGHGVQVNSITSDSEKARFIARLRGEMGSQADQHVKFLKYFQNDAQALLAALQPVQQKWEKYPPDSYLNMWSLAPEIAGGLKAGGEKLQQTLTKVNQGLAGTGLPDFAALVREIKDTLKPLQEALDKDAELVDKIGKISQALGDETKRKVAQAAVLKCSEAAKQMVQALGAGAPADPTAALNKYVEEAGRTAQLATAAAGQLENVAGEDNAELLRDNRLLLVVTGNVSIPLSDYFRLLSQLVSRDVQEAQAVAKNAKPDYQKTFIERIGPKAAKTAESIDMVREAADAALTQLAATDDVSKADMKLAAEGKLFDALVQKAKAVLAAADKLPELKDNSLSADIKGENIVVVETGGKVQVVDFDAVWPLKVRDFGMSAPQGPQKRAFNGDAAIASKILAMTHKPFATVLLTYWAPSRNMPPQMAQMIPQADIPPQALMALRKRLEEANFEVKDWDLNEPMPDPNESKERPKVLLVLPPPPEAQQPPWGQPQPLPKFTDEHRQKVIDAINSGTPAVFLTTFLPPRQTSPFMPPTQPKYEYAQYLRNQWGVEAMTDYLIVPAVTDETTPGRYKVDGQRFSYLPLSSFTGHPIGKPLQGQRVLWANLCPVEQVRDARGRPQAPPTGITIEPLLTIGREWKATWATRRIHELLRQFQTAEGNYISPDYEAGDLPVPLDVATAATRAGDEKKNVKPARIVVVGVGAGLMDGYLNREVADRDPKGTITLDDPPRLNADFLINSAYWLIGREKLIASGPVLATMKEIPSGMRALLMVIYCGLLPAVVLGVGGLVMVMRRR